MYSGFQTSLAFLKDIFAGYRIGTDSLGCFLCTLKVHFTEFWLARFLTENRHISSAVSVEGWVHLIRSKLGLGFAVALIAFSAQ